MEGTVGYSFSFFTKLLYADLNLPRPAFPVVNSFPVSGGGVRMGISNYFFVFKETIISANLENKC